MKFNTTTTMVGLAVLILGALILGIVVKNNLPSKYDDFAQCITDKGGMMYGAYWCPNCANQKEILGNAFRKIEYKECAVQGTRNLDLCADDGVTSVPTWQTAEGERVSGTQSLPALADFFGCELPE